MSAEQTTILHKDKFTLQQVVEILNVSQPFLNGLLEQGQIACCKTGGQCCILLEDVIAYKKHIDTLRHEVLDELTAQAQELNMGY